MRANTFLVSGGASAVMTLGVLASGGGAQTAAPPKARYYMDVSTATGPLAGGLGAIMRGGGESRGVTLNLGSTLTPTGGAAHADHFMPAGALLGASVPLATPTPTASEPSSPGTDQSQPGQYRRPKGRLLIYWGCGAHAGPGQPVVLDFARLAEGQVPPNLFSTAVPVDSPPSFATSRTYGYWPNGKGKKPQAGSSLLGDHRVEGNYSPPIAFSLAQDFLPALHAQSAAQPDGSGLLSWNAVAGATGYYAWAFGAGQDGDAIWWASASTRELGGGLWDYVSPATVARLIPRGTVMPPSRTSCAMPAEVKAAGQVVTFLNAYGPEADFAYPPRPASPRAVWKPDWTAKVRYKSSTMVIPGMGSMMRGQDGEPAKDKCKPSVGGMLGGMLSRGKCK